MASRYFIGAVDSDWHDTGNWSASSGGAGGASIPTVGDDAIFDSSSPSCVVDADIDCDSIQALSAGAFANTLNLNGKNWTGAGQLTWESGTIQFGSGTISLSGNIQIGGGTVNMQSAAVTTQGAVTGTAGTVTLTSGTLQLWGNLDLNVGTLTANNGTVEWIGAGVLTFNPRGKTFYNLKLTNPSVTVQGTLSCNSLEIAAGAGTWDCNGFNHTLAGALTVAGGTFDANGAATVTVTGTVTQTGGTIDLDTATVSMPGTVNVTGGTFTATSGTLTFGQSANAVTLTPATFNHNNGTVRHIPTFSSTKNLNWTGAAFNNFEMHNSGQSTVNVTGTATVAGNFTFANTGGSPSSRVLGGRVQVSGNVAAQALGLHNFGGSFIVEFTGAGAQSWTDAGTPGPTRKWTGIQINKSGGMVTLGTAAWIDTSLTVSTNHLATGGNKLVLCADAGSGDTFAWTPGGITYDDVETRMWAQARINVTGTALVGGKLTIQPALSGSGDRQVNGGQIDVYGNYEVGWVGDNANDAGSTLIRMVGAANANLLGQVAWAMRTRYGNPLTIAKTGGATVTQFGHFGLRSNDLNVNSYLNTNGYDIGARDITLGAGGTIVMTSPGIMRCYRTLDLVTGGGTWTPGTATVEMWSSSLSIPNQQITGSPTFNNLTIGNDSGASTNFTLALTGNPIVTGTLDLRGYNSGGWQRYINGNTLYARGAVLNTGSQPVFGTTLLYIDGAANQQVAINGGLSLTVAKATGLCQFTGVMVINATYGNVTHTYDASCDWITNNCAWTVTTSGGNRTVQLAGSGISSITVPGVSVNHAANTNPAILNLGGLTIFSGDTQYTASYSTHSRRIDNGIIDVAGNLVINIVDNGAYTGTALFKMTGGANKNLTFTAANQDRYWNKLEIAKTGGAKVTLVNALGTKGAGQTVAVTSGVLDLAGYSLTAGGTFSLAAGTTLLAKGSETITAAAKAFNVASLTQLYDNTVTALLDGLSNSFGNLNVGPGGKTVNTTAGATVAITGDLLSGGSYASKVLIRSTVPGTQARWNLGGTSYLGNTVNVQDNDASGGKTIYAIGSTDSGNNLNWVFGGGGGRHPRTAMCHACPEGFTGGLFAQAHDFIAYTGGGMPGMGAAGSAGSPPPAPGSRMIMGVSTPLAGTLQGRYTVDGGATWANSAWAPALVFPDYVACLLHLTGSTLLAFVSRSGSTKVYRSTNSGASFAQIGSISRQVRPDWTPIILPTGRIIVGVWDQTLGTDYICSYSDDNGATWTNVNIAVGQDASTYFYNTAHIARQADGKLCCLVISAIGSARIYYSADNGATWTMGNAPFSTTTIAIFRHPDGLLGSIRATMGVFDVYRHTEVAPGSWNAVLANSFPTGGGGNPCGVSFLDLGGGLNGRLLQHRNDIDQVDVLGTADGGASWAVIQSLGGAPGVAFRPPFNAAFLFGTDRFVPFDNQPTSVNDQIIWKDAGAGFARIGAIANAPGSIVPAGVVVT